MDIIGVALVMIMPFLLIPAFILMFRSTKKILKWFKTQSHGRRVERVLPQWPLFSFVLNV